MVFDMEEKIMTEKKTGLTVGNSAISAGISPQGRLFQRIIWNPPDFESGKNGLISGGNSQLLFKIDGKVFRDKDLSWAITENDYPRYQARAMLAPNVSVEICSWAPLAADNCESMFLPAICTSACFHSSDEKHEIGIGLRWDTNPAMLGESAKKEPQLYTRNGTIRAEKGCAFIGMSGVDAGSTKKDGNSFSLWGACTLCAEKKIVRTWFGFFPAKQRWRKAADSVQSLCGMIQKNYLKLEREVKDWIRCIPTINDEKIHQYTRWYSQAAVLLTKGDDSGTVITMGYTELNQRDSFWTSYVHLYFWPELEKTILRESCEWQRKDGKIPTTVLPVLEREYDIDINEYFCLRIGRYFRWHRDFGFLKECWPHFLKAVDFLLTRDIDKDGLPEQARPENPLCYWADWKDVRGIIGRKLAPHFVLLWLAVLREGAYLASELGKTEEKMWFREQLGTASRLVNQPAEKGGLWKSGCYREVWYDGTIAPYCLQDQTVGMAFDVVEPKRAEEIFRTLGLGENEAGIPETFPFRKEMEYPGGVYHNGGIWPFLTFCDCMGRYRTGRWRDAERLIHKIGYYDLELPDDWAPNEYLNGLTYENSGFEIQGWSSALFGVITHGAFEVSHSGKNQIEIRVNFPDRDFSTSFLLPAPFGRIMFGREHGKLFCAIDEKVRDIATVTILEGAYPSA